MTSRTFVSLRTVWPLLALALVSACSGEHHPQSILHPKGPVAAAQLHVFTTTLWVILGIFIVVGGAFFLAILRFREKPGDTREPEAVHGNTKLEVGFLVVSTLLLIVIEVPNIKTLFYAYTAPENSQPLRVNVIGHQWWWEFEYPDYGFRTGNEWHIPVGRPVEIKVTSADVIHSFWAPQFAGKTDTMPNQINQMWLQADEVGSFPGQCAELCGSSHAIMRFLTVVDSAAEFDAWMARQQQDAAQPASDATDVQAGATAFLTSGCIACHTVRGNPAAMGRIGPDLTHFGSRLTVADGLSPNRADNIATWLHNPQAVKPGALMVIPPLSDDTVGSLVAYLTSLK